MRRRTCLKLAPAAFHGLGRAYCKETTRLEAGPFSVSVPSDWEATAIIEKIPIRPLYSAEDWAAFQTDPVYTLKSGYANRPQHWALRFPAVALPGESYNAESAGAESEAPQLLIHKADEWASVLTDGIEKGNQRTVAKLRSDLEAARHSERKILGPPIWHWSVDFACMRKELSFFGGSGIRMVFQWCWEADLIRRGRLHYMFNGLSDDDTCQVIATFPLDHPSLPGRTSEDHLGWSMRRYEELAHGLAEYTTEATKWIEQNADGFSPRLETLDGIIQSLEAKHWE